MKKVLLAGILLFSLVSGSHAQTSLYSQTFNGGLGNCTSIDHNGTAGKWVFSTNPVNDASYGPIGFYSPTANNGFALILSDGNTAALNTDLITPSFSCSGQSLIALQFYEWMDIYQTAVAQVFISTDSTTWTLVFDAAQDQANNGYSAANPEQVLLNISAYAANQPKVWLKYNYQATNDDWWMVDDINVFTLPANDVAVDSVVIPNYVAASNGSTPINVMIENLGGDTLNSVQLSYQVGSTAPVTQTFTGLGLPSFSSTTVQFTTNFNFDSVALYTVTVTSASPNAGTDANLTNDTAIRQIVGISQVPNRNVLLEDFSTAICGYCPGAETYIGQIMASADSSFVIPVSIHAGFGTDGMTTNEADTLANYIDLQGAPTAAVNRELFYGGSGTYQGNVGLTVGVPGLGSGYPDTWQLAAEAEKSVITPVSISATNTYNPDTKEVTVVVSSTFYGPATGDFRMNCYIAEDSVVGTGAGYDQHSYYYSSPTTGNPWLNVGTYSASNGYATIAGFVHNGVERAMMNGIWGDSTATGNIPHNPTPGTTYTQTYHYTLSNTWRTKFLRLAAFVSQYNPNFSNSEYNVVWNVVGMKLNVPTGIQETGLASNMQMALYPNPAQNLVTLAYTLDNDATLSFEVYNTLGQLVSSHAQSNFAKGSYTTAINTTQLANGIYFVNVKSDNKLVQALKFVIAK